MDVQHIDNTNNNDYQLAPSLIAPPFIKAKADSDASNHYWRPQDVNELSNIKSTMTGPKVKLPINKIIQAKKLESSILPQPNFLQKERRLMSSPIFKMLCLFHLANLQMITVSQY